MIDGINREGFELIKLVNFKPKESHEKHELIGSFKEKGFIDLTEKLIGSGIEKTVNHEGKTVEIYLINERGYFGFNKEGYLRFSELIQKLSLLEQLNKKLSLKFIEAESFNWILDVYKNQQAVRNLFDYLVAKMDEEVQSLAFYFPILNLEIEESFKIGNTEFVFFKKEYFDKLYESIYEIYDTHSEAAFEHLFRKDFQGQVLARVIILAEREKAEEIAKKEAEISVNVLKLFSESVFVPEIKTMFDLNFKLGYQVQSNFLIEKLIDRSRPILNTQYNNRPYFFSTARYKAVFQHGLKVFSDYILLGREDELCKIIFQSINLFGSAISNWDLHLRCVNLITILESIFLDASESNNMEHKTKARLSKILTQDHQKKERLKTVFSSIYQVRHKMIHKAIRVEINIKELSEAQMEMVNLFFRLIELNTKSGFKNKEMLIKELNHIKS